MPVFPAVSPGGETDNLTRALIRFHRTRKIPVPFPQSLTSLAPADFAAIGDDYVERMRPWAAGTPHVTDKLPGNFLYVGLIHLAMPNAKIIHCLREPADTCLSCYMQLFRAGLAFTFDLSTLGRYYRKYHELMAHWRSVLPEGAFLDVRYEDVVADLETQARRIVAHCGLPWDSQCLEFNENKRPVRTASVAQVREPLYTRSLGRWHHYEPYLGPLFEALGDLAPASGDSK